MMAVLFWDEEEKLSGCLCKYFMGTEGVVLTSTQRLGAVTRLSGNGSSQ